MVTGNFALLAGVEPLQDIKRVSDYCQGATYWVSESAGEEACPFNAQYWLSCCATASGWRAICAYRRLVRMAEGKREALGRSGGVLLARLDAGEAL